MPTQQEINSFINKHFADRYTARDELAAYNAVIGLEISGKLDTLISLMSGGVPGNGGTVPPACQPLIEGCIVGVEGYAMGNCEANSSVSVAIRGQSYSCLSKDNINEYEKVVIVGGTTSEPYVAPVRRVNVIDTNTVYEPRSMHVEWEASTVADPVVAGAGYTTGIPEHKLLSLSRGTGSWGENQYLVIYAVGTDTHESSFYRWVIDNQDYDSISRKASIGSILNPYYFPGGGEKAYQNVELWITNESASDIPNTLGGTSDAEPYQGIVHGRFYNKI